jgi:hypothetical protein
VFINTGRVYANVEERIRNIGFDGFVCGCGTTVIYDNKLLFHREIPQDECIRLALKCRELGFHAVFEHMEKTCIDGENGTHPVLMEMINYFASDGRKIITDINDKDFGFDKFAAWYDDPGKVAEMKAYLEKDYDFIDREENFCEVVPKGYSKATGIKLLLDYFKLPLESAYAFGDGNNDEPMLSYVENSIIMQKGPDNLKAIVKMVTEDVEDNGIYNAMKRLGII